jgi:hypothetical protein
MQEILLGFLIVGYRANKYFTIFTMDSPIFFSIGIDAGSNTINKMI